MTSRALVHRSGSIIYPKTVCGAYVVDDSVQWTNDAADVTCPACRVERANGDGQSDGARSTAPDPIVAD